MTVPTRVFAGLSVNLFEDPVSKLQTLIAGFAAERGRAIRT